MKNLRFILSGLPFVSSRLGEFINKFGGETKKRRFMAEKARQPRGMDSPKTSQRCRIERMSDLAWNSITVEEEEKPRVDMEELRDMARELDPDDFDDDVQNFLEELLRTQDIAELRQAATLLLQDEIDLSPELAAMGVEPEEALISLLLACGADVAARNAYGQPPLHLAAQYGYERIVDMLLTAGASIRQRNDKGQYAAELAASPELAARLQPPPAPAGDEEEPPLPPEIEDADYEQECGHECSCHGDERGECHCHADGHECSCGHEHS